LQASLLLLQIQDLVVDNLTSGGKIDAPVGQRIFWYAEGTVAVL
jgi:choline/glycine/proline betaine transport protein